MVYWLGIIFLILGVFISVTNWYYAIKWMCKKYKNRRASNIDGTFPFFGGVLCTVGLGFFSLATERYLLALAAIPFGIIIDFWWGGQAFIYPVFFKFLEQTKNKKTQKIPKKRESIVKR